VVRPLARQWPAIQNALGVDLVPLEEPRDALRTARLRLGLTQEALAVLAGIDVRTVRNSEKGVSGPRQDTRARLQRVLRAFS